MNKYGHTCSTCGEDMEYDDVDNEFFCPSCSVYDDYQEDEELDDDDDYELYVGGDEDEDEYDSY